MSKELGLSSENLDDAVEAAMAWMDEHREELMERWRREEPLTVELMQLHDKVAVDKSSEELKVQYVSVFADFLVEWITGQLVRSLDVIINDDAEPAEDQGLGWEQELTLKAQLQLHGPPSDNTRYIPLKEGIRRDAAGEQHKVALVAPLGDQRIEFWMSGVRLVFHVSVDLDDLMQQLERIAQQQGGWEAWATLFTDLPPRGKKVEA